MINLIVCADLNGGIGYNGGMLAHIPSELKYFKKLTDNSVCIMGRKTFESILKKNGRPLDGRLSIVITRNPEVYGDFYKTFSEVLFTDDIEKVKKIALDENPLNENVYVCGGEEVYNLFIDDAEYIHLTTIMNEFDEVDTYFPLDKLDEFTPVKSNSFIDEESFYGYNITQYSKEKGE